MIQFSSFVRCFGWLGEYQVRCDTLNDRGELDTFGHSELDWQSFGKKVCEPIVTQPTKGAGTLRRAVRSQAFARILGGRHMECAYYFNFCLRADGAQTNIAT